MCNLVFDMFRLKKKKKNSHEKRKREKQFFREVA